MPLDQGIWDFHGFPIAYLVGGDWNMTGLFFHSVENFIIPIDELIVFRGVGIPPTRLPRILVGSHFSILFWGGVTPSGNLT